MRKNSILGAILIACTLQSCIWGDSQPYISHNVVNMESLWTSYHNILINQVDRALQLQMWYTADIDSRDIIEDNYFCSYKIRVQGDSITLLDGRDPYMGVKTHNTTLDIAPGWDFNLPLFTSHIYGGMWIQPSGDTWQYNIGPNSEGNLELSFQDQGNPRTYTKTTFVLTNNTLPLFEQDEFQISSQGQFIVKDCFQQALVTYRTTSPLVGSIPEHYYCSTPLFRSGTVEIEATTLDNKNTTAITVEYLFVGNTYEYRITHDGNSQIYTR